MTEPSQAPHLPRRIGVGGATLLSFNSAVGSAVFALPAVLAADFGTFAPWMFPLVALGTLLIAVPFARSVAAFPENGGPATYGLVFGRVAGFELGWIYYVARAAAYAANLNVMIAYLARWFEGVDAGASRVVLMVAVTALLAFANVIGTKRALRLLGGFTLLKTLPLVIVAMIALANAGFPAAPQLPQFTSFEAGVLIVFYAFIGFENSVTAAGETERPERSLPRAIFATIGATALLYFLVELAFVAIFPAGVQRTDAPLLELGQAAAGTAGVVALTAAAIFSIAGNLHGNLAATPRVTYAMGAHGDLPSWFARIDPKFETPANSIVFMAVLTAVLAVSGSFVWLAVVSTLARMVVYAMTIAALPRAPGRPRLSKFNWASGVLGIAICAWAATQADLRAWVTLGALAAAGLILYMLASMARQTSTG